MFMLLNASNLNNKKYRAVFYNSDTERKIKTVHFGSSKNNDYLIYNKTVGKEKADDRKQLYIKRNEKRQLNLWNNKPMSPAALSRWLLWNLPTMEQSIDSYLDKFPEVKKVVVGNI